MNQYGIERFLQVLPKNTLPPPSSSLVKPTIKKKSTVDKTWDLYLQKKSLDEIATIRGLKINTIKEHFVSKLPDERVNIEDLMPLETYNEIKKVYDALGNVSLNAIKQQVNYSINYTEIKLVRNVLFEPEKKEEKEEQEEREEIKQIKMVS